MLKNINWLGIISLILTLFALLLSATLYFFIFGMFFAIFALVFAYFAPKTRIVKVSQFFSVIILFLGTVLLVIGLF